MCVIRAAVREVSPGQALFRTATMQQVIEESLANPRLYTWLLALFATGVERLGRALDELSS